MQTVVRRRILLPGRDCECENNQDFIRLTTLKKKISKRNPSLSNKIFANTMFIDIPLMFVRLMH